jgi:5,10-methenyltetrahydrofolate synthetase
MSIPLASGLLRSGDHASRQQWRRHCRLLMAGISEKQKKAVAIEIGTRLLQFIVESNVKTLAVYWPIHDEPDLLPLWQMLRDKGFQLALPCVVARGEVLSFSLWGANAELVMNQWGIAEVNSDGSALVLLQEIEMIVMPCVGYWRSGHRLGYGGGFYDRTLEHWRNMPLPKGSQRIAVGLAYSNRVILSSQRMAAFTRPMQELR